MNKHVSNYSLPVLLLASALISGCGWGILGWGGGGGGGSGPKINIVGNIRDVTPVTAREIVIFVYSVDDKNSHQDGDLCPCPGLPCLNGSKGEAVVLDVNEDDFEINKVNAGAVRLVFLLDNAGDDADGQIDDGDLIAILDDVDCRLDDVSGKMTVTLEDIDINFAEADITEDNDRDCKSNVVTIDDDTCEDGNSPADGRARADSIVITSNNNNNNDDADDEEN